MKKRKKPIMLVTLLAVLAGIVFAMSSSGSDPSREQPPTPEPPKSDQPRVTPSATDLARAANANKGQPTPPPGMPKEAARAMREATAGSPKGMITESDDPTIEVPAAAPITKPTPNDSSIAGQWYSDESHKQGN